MRHLLIFILLLSSLASSAQQKKVLICTGSGSYAYHITHCRGLNQCKASIETVTVAEAQSLNRKPCGYCMKGSTLATTTKPKARVQGIVSNRGQCRAITKKGSRCSRNAGASGYCWQHG